MKTIFDRARAYLGAMPPGISGHQGHPTTFSAAVALRHGFDLPDHDAWSLLMEYNQRCQPPWNLVELQHKFNSVQSQKHPKERGHLAKNGDRTLSGKQNKFISHLPALCSTPTKKENSQPKIFGIVRLPERYLTPVTVEPANPLQDPPEIEDVAPLKLASLLPSYRAQTPSEGCCSMCWNRWGRYLREGSCICTGDVML